MTIEEPADLVLEYDLDAPPDKVRRALGVADIRRRWFPDHDLADPDAVETMSDGEIRYRMKERWPPFLESIVRFQIAPQERGGTRLTIVHRVVRPTSAERPQAGNGNVMGLRLAA